MRIIAGKFKGKKLDFVSNEKTRPTTNMVREALFCKIQFDVVDSVFLDLFAGSGATGLEALSRGAKEIYFVERDKKNLEIIKKNLKTLYDEDYEKSASKQGQKIHLINSGYLIFLDKISLPCRTESKNLINKKRTNNFDSFSDFSMPYPGRSDAIIFDFVYIDPPYKSDFYEIALQKLKENNCITNESIIICEHDISSAFINDSVLKNFQIVAQKKYGKKMLTYLKLNTL